MMWRSSVNLPKAAGLALVLCVVGPAVAQVPQDRDQSQSSTPPHYVDSADYTRQPYYVDGVQYKPYVPEKKKGDKAKAAPAVKGSNADDETSQDNGATPDNNNGLHPYVPVQSPPTTVEAQAPADGGGITVAPRPHASASASASSSSSSSEQAYVPKKRTRYAAAVIQALDKVTAETVRFEAPIGQPIRYKGLIYTVKACETTADDEPMQDVIAYMQVRTSPNPDVSAAQQTPSKEIFHGWTFASAPGLNPLQDRVYDAWVVGCRRPLPGVADGKS